MLSLPNAGRYPALDLAAELGMIDRLVGNKSLPASLRQDIIARTDGIPLFVEEARRNRTLAIFFLSAPL